MLKKPATFSKIHFPNTLLPASLFSTSLLPSSNNGFHSTLILRMRDGNEMLTPHQKMTPLGDGPDGDANGEKNGEDPSSKTKETLTKASNSHLFKRQADMPTSASSWRRLAMITKGNETVILTAPSVAASTALPDGTSTTYAARITSKMARSGEASESVDCSIDQLHCMFIGMLPYLKEDIVKAIKASKSVNLFAADEIESALSECDESAVFLTHIQQEAQIIISRHWTLFGSMFSCPNKTIDVVEVLSEALGLVLYNDESNTKHSPFFIDAAYCYQKALTIWPDNGAAWNNLGTILAQAEAEGLVTSTPSVSPTDCFAKAVSSNPKHSNAWFNLMLRCNEAKDGKDTACVELRRGKTDLNGERNSVCVTRDEAFVKAITVETEAGYNDFLMAKGFLDVAHSADISGKTHFNSSQAIISTLNNVLCSLEMNKNGVKNEDATRLDLLNFDLVALWYYASQCCCEVHADNDANREAPSSITASKSLPTCVSVNGTSYSAKQCLVEAVEVMAATHKANVEAAKGTNVVGGGGRHVSPFAPSVWEALSKYVKGDDTITIAGETLTAEDVFSNQFEC